MLGEQAVIGSLPLSLSSHGDVMLTRVGDMSEIPLTKLAQVLIGNPVSEYFVSSVHTDGIVGKFCNQFARAVEKLFEQGLVPRRDIIWFGGLDALGGSELLRMKSTRAIAFGNINVEKEINIPLLRNALSDLGLRK
jgi:hypothetical protein